MRITAYLRVSTDKQAEHGNGLDVQRNAITVWAKANGHKIVAWHRDEGISGSNGLDTRETLPFALADVREHRATGIVVYKLDRLARDLIIQETLISEIRRMGGEIFTTSAGEAGYLADDPSDPSRKMIRQILGAVNEYEKSMIVLRMKSGRAIKAKRGGYAYGSPAYGQRATGGELITDEEESATVNVIMNLHRAGLSLRNIALHLNSDGLTSKRGGQWSAKTVSRVISRVGQH
jgi:DNA invertase Pin-like site-specific DNA recombinase